MKLGKSSCLAAALAFASCTATPGEADFTFTWEGDPPIFTRAVFLTTRLESHSAIIQTSPPERFASDVNLTFPVVPAGVELTMIAEVRDGPYANSRALYYGISEPFTLYANDHLSITTVLRPGPPPFAPPLGPPPPNVAKLTRRRDPGHDLLRGEAGALQGGGLLVFSGAEIAESTVLARLADPGGAAFELPLGPGFSPKEIFVATLNADNLLSDTSTIPGLQASLVQKISLADVFDPALDHLGRTALLDDARDPPAYTRVAATGEERFLLTAADEQVYASRAVPVWHEHADSGRSPPARAGAALTADPVRGQLVLFGGRGRGRMLDDTWVHDGDRWLDRTPLGGPSARQRAALSYDAARDRALLFGGETDAEVFGDLWEWDGRRWREIVLPDAADRPEARAGHTLVYDPNRARVILFGGRAGDGTLLGDTWSWDGKTWSRIEGDAPPARAGHAMIFDPGFEHFTLFGGRTDSGMENDLWAFDGASWAESTSTKPAPDPREGAAFIVDPHTGRPTLFGGRSASHPFSDVWSLDGEQWISSPSHLPTVRAELVAAASPALASVILFGGDRGDIVLDQTLRFRGDHFFDRTPTYSPAPGARAYVSMDYDDDRDRFVVGGGMNSLTFDNTLWEWDEQGWHPRGDLPFRYGPADFAYDRARKKHIVFGGDPSRLWEWDSNDWVERALPQGMERSYAARIAYDEASARILLFGGAEEPSRTWAYDGGWSVAAMPRGDYPPPRYDHQLAYDPVHQQMVLYGGEAPYEADRARVIWGDVWHFSGSTWTLQLDGPVYRYALGMAYDRARERMLMQGGIGLREGDEHGATLAFDELRVLRGVRWELLDTLGDHPRERAGHAMAYDPIRERMVIFGGFDGTSPDSYRNDLWTLDMPSGQKPAVEVVFAIGARAGTKLRLFSFELSAFAGGRGCPDGGPTAEPGAVLKVWSRVRGAWVELTATEAGLDRLEALTGGRSSDAQDFLDAQDQLYVRVEPRYGSGTDTDDAAVSVDAINLRADFELEP